MTIQKQAAEGIEVSDKKTAAIINAAHETFLAFGFDAASMDRIADTAGVSKRTVYSRFRSKEELFAATITESCRRILPVNFEDIDIGLPPKDLIQRLARQVVDGIFEPDALAIRRIAAFEAQRRPSLGKAYLEHGPQFMVNAFAPLLQRLADRGAVSVDDPHKAVWRLGVLITEPLHMRLMLGDYPDDLNKAIDDQISEGINAFMTLHAPTT